MKVFITGATKALGLPTVKLLKAQGHDVYGLSRSAENDQVLQALGAQPVRANIFDQGTMVVALEGMDAVLHLATKIPAANAMGKQANWAENDLLRRDATRVLVGAALQTASVQTIVYPGFFTVYKDGKDQWIDASNADTESSPTIQSSLDAEAAVQDFSKRGRRGITLRMGMFYSADSAGIDTFLMYAKKGIAALPGSREQYLPFMWIEDAARAIVAALVEDVPAGNYDVVDDTPLTRQQIFDLLAHEVGKKSLFVMPSFLMRLMMGVKYGELAKSYRISNQRLKEVSSWRPEAPDLRQSLPNIHRALQSKQA